MKKIKKVYIKIMKYLILSLIFLFSLSSFSIIGHDDRFYIHGTKWGKLLNGIVKINDSCNGFLVEGDVIVTVAHCFGFHVDPEKKKNFKAENGYELDLLFPFTKDSKIDYTKIETPGLFTVTFEDIDADYNDLKDSYEIDVYKIKDFFAAYDPLEDQPESIEYAKMSKDYAFIKLHKIPKNIKRFKIFHPDLLKDYKILKHPYKGNLSTAGYHGDSEKTRYQRMAHIGCKVRNMRKYKKVWFDHSDCDTYNGASGSPLFYILRHKKTKKIELAVRSIVIRGTSLIISRRQDTKYINKKSSKPDEVYLDRLGFGYHYHAHYKPFGLASILITDHKEFLSNLEKFKKDSSFFRNKKIPKLEKSKYLNKNWILKNIIQKKSLKELKEFLDKDLERITRRHFEHRGYDSFPYSRVVDTRVLIRNITEDLNIKIDASKRKLLKQDDYIFLEKDLLRNRMFYPYQKRAKKMSHDRVFRTEEDYMRTPFEDPAGEKKKARKLWNMYFSKDQKKAKKLKSLYFFK